MSDPEKLLDDAAAEALADAISDADAKYRCQVCGDPFAKSQQLAAHVKKTGHKQEPADKAPKPDAPAPRKGSLERRLAEQFAVFGLTVSAGDPICGQHIIQRAEPTARALDKLAQENPRIKALLESSMTGSTWFGAIGQLAMLALPIMAHHKMIPPGVAVQLFGQQFVPTSSHPPAPPAAA